MVAWNKKFQVSYLFLETATNTEKDWAGDVNSQVHFQLIYIIKSMIYN